MNAGNTLGTQCCEGCEHFVDIVVSLKSFLDRSGADMDVKASIRMEGPPDSDKPAYFISFGLPTLLVFSNTTVCFGLTKAS